MSNQSSIGVVMMGEGPGGTWRRKRQFLPPGKESLSWCKEAALLSASTRREGDPWCQHQESSFHPRGRTFFSLSEIFKMEQAACLGNELPVTGGVQAEGRDSAGLGGGWVCEVPRCPFQALWSTKKLCWRH